MKKLDSVERFLLESVDINKYNVYRCKSHGVYQILTTEAFDKQVCLYCRQRNELLFKDDIDKLLA